MLGVNKTSFLMLRLIERYTKSSPEVKVARSLLDNAASIKGMRRFCMLALAYELDVYRSIHVAQGKGTCHNTLKQLGTKKPSVVHTQLCLPVRHLEIRNLNSRYKSCLQYSVR